MPKREPPDLPPLMPDQYGNAFWSMVADLRGRPSSKAFFDNARNYGIAVSIGGGGTLVWKQADSPAAFSAGAFLMIIGVLLGLLNVLQSWVLFLHTFHTHVDMLAPREPWWSSMLKTFGLLSCAVLIPVSAWYLMKLILTTSTTK